MRLRPRRQNLVIWSSSAVGAGCRGPGFAGHMGPTRSTRSMRIRWWLRTGALLTVIGVRWLVRAAWVHWEPVWLLAGTVLMVAGIALPAVGVFFAGLLVLIVTLLRGIAGSGRGTGRPTGGPWPG